MEIQGTYYHIQKFNPIIPFWSPGMNINIETNTYNQYYNSILSSLGSYKYTNTGTQVKLLKYANSILNQKSLDPRIIKDTCEELKDVFGQYLKWIRETIFEKVRLRINPKLPSRNSCLWICSYDDLANWYSIFAKSCLIPSRDLRIFKVKVNGIYHQADGTLIQADTYTIEDFEDAAAKYWSGKIDHFKEIEILFNGHISVVEEFKNIRSLLENHRHNE